MIVTKENVVVYTVQIDKDEINKIGFDFEIVDLFAKEFEREGMKKEAKKMKNGGFSYKETLSTSYYVEYEISITTRTQYL